VHLRVSSRNAFPSVFVFCPFSSPVLMLGLLWNFRAGIYRSSLRWEVFLNEFIFNLVN
jgi:hypothetical protein